MSQLFYFPSYQALSSSGSALPAAQLFFYITGTSTAAAVYGDAARTTTLANPVIADSQGRFPQIYPNPDIIYRAVLKDSGGTQQWLQDGVTIQTFPCTAAEISAGILPVSYAYEPLDTRRYGWVNDSNTTSGPGNYSALKNALAVAGQSIPGSTVRIRGGGANEAYVQGSTTIAWPDYVGIEVDNQVQVIWNDMGSSAFCLTNGAAGARHGGVFSKNLCITLGTPTACGMLLFNTVSSTHINLTISGYTGSYSTRTNIGLQLQATPTTGACWFNDFYGLNLDHCHIGLNLPSSSGGYVTQNTFYNLRHFGDATLGDPSAIAVSAAAGTGCIVSGFYIEAIGASGFGFKFQGVSLWQVDNGTFDTDAAPFTAVSLDANCTSVRFGKGVFFSPNAYVLNGAPNSAQNVVESIQGTVNGDGFAQGHQAALGLNDGQGYLGQYFRPATEGLILNNTIQAVQGGAFCPLDNLLYLTTKQGNLIAYSPVAAQIASYVAYSATTGDSDPIFCCFCPSNGFIYVADRQDNSVVIVNPKTLNVVQTLNLVPTAGSGCAPYGIAYCPFNQKVYVANDGTENLSIITPTSNGTDSVAQTLSGFAVGLITVAYCPITQRMYLGGNSSSIFVVTPTITATDSISQTLAASMGTSCWAIVYCPLNQKIYAISGGSTRFVSINPTPNGTDTVLTSGTLSAGGNSASLTRGACWNPAAQAIVCASPGSPNVIATILPSVSGTSDLCTQVQPTAGGEPLQVVYHPGTAKTYELNPLETVIEWS
jgi:YVTN family beta-propeller protein